MGAVGLSKLQRIAPWVTPENAAWWAEQLVTCTRVQLDALIARLKAAPPAERERIKKTPTVPSAELRARALDGVHLTMPDTRRYRQGDLRCGRL